MIAYVGSTNPIKVAAVAAVAKRDPRLAMIDADDVRGCVVRSAVAAQPRTLDETIRGALHRARCARHEPQRQRSVGPVLRADAAAGEADSLVVGIGLESGVFDRVYEVGPKHETVLFDVTVCAIVGPSGCVGVGLSPAWIVPDDFANAIRGQGLEMDEAYARSRPDAPAHVGQRGGLVAVCSQGITTRQMLTEAAIEMALIGWTP